MNQKSRRKSREWALRTLYQMDVSNCSFEQAFESAREPDSANAEDYAKHLCQGVINNRSIIDDEIAAISHGYALDRIAAVDLAILRVAMFEINHSTGIPPAVAIDEAVELGKKFSTEQSGAFINGILGAALRSKTQSKAVILDGKSLSAKIREQLKQRVAELGINPRLDVLMAANDPASVAYVKMKRKWGGQIGIGGELFAVDDSTTQSQLLEKIRELNANDEVHGVLIQHPLPKHLNESEALETLGANKDVDGITPQSLGRLTAGLEGFRCATPLGMMRILDEYNIECRGKNAVVVGRSVILGKPCALMLLERDATVTIAHSKTQNLPELCRTADILVAAVGKPEMIKGDWIKPGAVVLDAGYNKLEGRTTDVGDVEFESASKIASAITPVPGGVGPMTVAMLLSNVVLAAEAASKLSRVRAR